MGLSLSIQGITIQANIFVLPVAACQAVLGVQWLETLGSIETDYKKLIMSFKQADQTHLLKGITNTKLVPLNEKELLHLSRIWFFVHIVVEVKTYPTMTRSLDLSHVLP